MFVYLLVS